MTDVTEIIALAFPIYYRTISALTTRILGLEGAINVPIAVGGVVIRPGDVIFGDENGIAVLPAERAAYFAPILAEQERNEVALRQRLDAGESLATLSGARQHFERGLTVRQTGQADE